jgi:hypothetical protein
MFPHICMCYISGHKNVASINSYSRLNQNQQKHISKVLADTEGKILYGNGKSDRQVDVGSSMGQLCSSHDSHTTMPCPPAIGTQPYSTANQPSTNTMSADTRLSSFFQGNTYIYGGTCNFCTKCRLALWFISFLLSFISGHDFINVFVNLYRWFMPMGIALYHSFCFWPISVCE